MAKQTFTTGQVLTAAQMTSLQQTAMGGGAATAKTASYTLVAADAGTTVAMNAAGATTITVNTGLFAAGDTVFIQNLGAGVCTITAGTATVNTSASLALAQYDGGTLYFTSASASLFFKADGVAVAGGGKVLQVVTTTTSTQVSTTGTTYVDTGLSLAITPTLATSKVLVLTSQPMYTARTADDTGGALRLLRGATSIYDVGGTGFYTIYMRSQGSNTASELGNIVCMSYLDSPATTSSTTYKTQMRVTTAGSTPSIYAQIGTATSSIVLLEIGV